MSNVRARRLSIHSVASSVKRKELSPLRLCVSKQNLRVSASLRFTVSAFQNLLARTDFHIEPVFAGRERARPVVAVGARGIVGIIEVEHDPIVRVLDILKVTAFDGVEEVATAAVALIAAGQIAEREEQTS